MEFLFRNNKTDLAILKNTKTAIETRNIVSVFHNATICSHGLMHAGTSVDQFLRDNLEWLGRANNWSKFSAIASLGVIHRVTKQNLNNFFFWRTQKKKIFFFRCFRDTLHRVFSCSRRTCQRRARRAPTRHTLRVVPFMPSASFTPTTAPRLSRTFSRHWATLKTRPSSTAPAWASVLLQWPRTMPQSLISSKKSSTRTQPSLVRLLVSPWAWCFSARPTMPPLAKW